MLRTQPTYRRRPTPITRSPSRHLTFDRIPLAALAVAATFAVPAAFATPGFFIVAAAVAIFATLALTSSLTADV